jgi:hypothetical protein
VASKKTTRSRKTTPPVSSPDESGKVDPPFVERRRPTAAKARPAAKPAARVASRPKRAANGNGASPASDVVPLHVAVTDDEIRVRAYFLSVEYQGPDRNDVDFWLLAERELRPTEKSNG